MPPPNRLSVRGRAPPPRPAGHWRRVKVGPGRYWRRPGLPRQARAGQARQSGHGSWNDSSLSSPPAQSARGAWNGGGGRGRRRDCAASALRRRHRGDGLQSFHLKSCSDSASHRLLLWTPQYRLRRSRKGNLGAFEADRETPRLICCRVEQLMGILVEPCHQERWLPAGSCGNPT